MVIFVKYFSSKLFLNITIFFSDCATAMVYFDFLWKINCNAVIYNIVLQTIFVILFIPTISSLLTKVAKENNPNRNKLISSDFESGGTVFVEFGEADDEEPVLFDGFSRVNINFLG